MPLSPKVSFVPIYSCGTGQFFAATCATTSPIPPIILCSSAVTTQPVFCKLFIIAASSNGLIVCKLITSTLMPSASNCFAASIAFHTKCPQAIILTSFPSAKICAFPITKSDPSSLVKLGHFGLPNLK